MQYDKNPESQALIFDLDGTLANTMPLHYQAWQKACHAHGIELEKDFFRKYTGTPAWKMAGIMINHFKPGADIDPESLWNHKIEEYSRNQHQVTAVEPVAAILKQYHGTLPVAVGTGGHKKAVMKTLEYTGLKPYFEVIVTANDVENHKPHPETFLRCAELLGAAPAVCEVFEDGDRGLQAARSAGMIATDVRSWYESF